jgi:adenylate cyclase
MTQANPIIHKTAAVIQLDIAGFSAMMSSDELLAIRAVEKQRELVAVLAKKYFCNFVKDMGDGLLLYTSHSEDAALFAIELQQQLLYEPFKIRIGLHWGNIRVSDNDVFGDTINVAARLEPICEPGGICASGEIVGACKGKLDLKPVSIGLINLHGIGRLVEVYGFGIDDFPTTHGGNTVRIPSDQQLSLAVMPFDNLGGKKDEYLAFGLSEDLIQSILKLESLQIASLRSVIQLLEEGNTLQQIARRLNVAFLLEGSILRSGNWYKVKARMIDGNSGKVLFAAQWEEETPDLMNIRIKLEDSIAKFFKIRPLDTQSISVSQSQSKIAVLHENRVLAYEFYLRGRHRFSKAKDHKDVTAAKEMFCQAIDLDPNLVESRLSLVEILEMNSDFESALEHAYHCLRLADFGASDALVSDALNRIGAVYSRAGNIRKAREYFARSLEYRENLGDKKRILRSLNNLGTLKRREGYLKQGAELISEALEMARNLGDRETEMGLLTNLSTIEKETGNLSQATKLLKAAELISTELGDIRSRALILSNLAVVSGKTDLPAALDLATRAVQSYEKLGDTQEVARGQLNLAKILQELKQYDQAIIETLKGLGYSQQSQSKHLSCMLRFGLAGLYVKMGQIDLAQQTSEILERDIGSVNQLNLRIQFWWTLGLLFEKMSDKENAHRLCLQAARAYHSSISTPDQQTEPGSKRVQNKMQRNMLDYLASKSVIVKQS